LDRGAARAASAFATLYPRYIPVAKPHIEASAHSRGKADKKRPAAILVETGAGDFPLDVGSAEGISSTTRRPAAGHALAGGLATPLPGTPTCRVRPGGRWPELHYGAAAKASVLAAAYRPYKRG